MERSMRQVTNKDSIATHPYIYNVFVVTGHFITTAATLHIYCSLFVIWKCANGRLFGDLNHDLDMVQ